MKPRAFNEIQVDNVNNTILKTSSNKSKLKDEVDYYLSIPSEISQLFPSMVDYNKDYSGYKLEFIPYQNLADLILNNQLSYSEGVRVINNLLDILDKFHSFNKKDPINGDISKFCVEKTLFRLNELNANSFFEKFSKVGLFDCNEQKLENFIKIKERFINKLKSEDVDHANSTVIHGDFCFSNILYCPKKKDIKLVDPRGSFIIPGIYGHPYYDYAKLLHCLHGEYDYIVNNNFELTESNNFKFGLKIKSSPLLKKLCSYFLSLLKMKKINLDYLFLVEGSLFISMVNLHYECFRRQKALFLKGLIILNEALKDREKEEEKIYAYLH